MRKNGTRGEKSELKKVFRFATAADMEKFEAARSREHSTMIRARKIAEELSLNMKIGDVEYQGDGAKAIFYYIADERVDFRKLIRVLADAFKVKIEMKQIGARQEAGRIGGIGPCGRPLCCSSWMTHFVSVGTGAARLQDLSMNPQKLAGQCAKLKCCINFETDIYAEAVKKLPPKDVPLETQDATYYYFKPDIIAGKITYSTDKKIPANLVTIDAARANEIIALNKQGVKVESLEKSSKNAKKSEEAYVDLVEQESLTRFDKSKNRRKKGKSQPKQSKQPKPQSQQQAQQQPQQAQQQSQQPQQQQRRRRPRQQKPKTE
jgi:cell fate regulator YaaT (PSP1 superfamily)